MSETPPAAIRNLPELHQVGDGTIEQRIGPGTVAALSEQGVGLAGTSFATRDFDFVRWQPNFAQVLVSLRGTGEVWCENRWVTVNTGWAYVTPPRKFHAYHTARSCERWDVGWVVVYLDSKHPFPYLPAEPRLVETDATLFEAALTGLASESAGRADVAMLDSWARLVRGLASRIAGNAPRDELIDILWRRIASHLNAPWTLEEMAATLGCSEEHLRRLCQRHYGCSPMRRLTAMRMQHAASLLSETHLTIAAISKAVGYDNEFAFSNAFRRWSRGAPPSRYRNSKGRSKAAVPASQN